MDNWIKRFRDSEAKEGEKVLIPGDPEREEEKKRIKDGITLNDKVIDDLKEVGKKFSLSFG